jgi:hypothetical protein
MENYNLKNSPPTKKIKVNLLQALIWNKKVKKNESCENNERNGRNRKN